MQGFFHQAKSISDQAADTLDHARRLASSVYAPGFHAAYKAWQGESFWQFRPYLPDDPRRDIDWRKTARSETAIIRQREAQQAQSLNLWIDPNPGMSLIYAPKRESKIWCAQVLSLALGFLALRQHDIARTIGPDATVARSEQGMIDIATDFHDLKLSKFEELDKIPLRTSGIYILAGDFLAPLDRIEKMFKALNRPDKKFLILQYLDPDELSLPYQGRVLFSDGAQQQSQQIDHVPDVKDAYQDKIQNHLDGLKTLCAAQNFLYLRHLCGDNTLDTLNAAVHLLNEERRQI